MKKPSRFGWAFCSSSLFHFFTLFTSYGVMDCVAWLPCGTAMTAMGYAPVG